MGGGMMTQATLVEQNADLLSFIAKKERKCLDLREELKRHEAELALLKKKWESIVARSLQQQAYASSAPTSSLNRARPSISSSGSPNTSPTPLPHATLPPTHSLDLSLLSSTFDAPPDGEGESSTPIEIPESVKAAGTWIGGALGRVLEVAVGMPTGMEGPHGHIQQEARGLGIVREEEEEEGEEGAQQDRRARSSMDGSATGSTSHTQTRDSEATSSNVRPLPARTSSSPSLSRPSRLFSPSQSTSSPSTSPTHTRTRSSLSLLSSSLSSKWAQLSSSEVVQNSKRATMGLVDTFEQGLSQALGPLELPPIEGAGEEERRSRRQDVPSPFLRHDSAGEKDTSAQQRSAPSHSPNPQQRPNGPSLPALGAVPGQGLSSMFASLSSAVSSHGASPPPPAPASTSNADKTPTASTFADASTARGQGGWDWSAFLPTTSSLEGVAEEAGLTTWKERASEDERREEKGKGREVEKVRDEGEWPGW
ncbi:hypothetical protein Rt10032_c12g4852 [Rhodotorula toruloides]|uniref:Uncharacterized protein n=1 Tax=Rhodotorula toruloides TaxID=5286 RepID=A0A511KLL0_RHOTO|nr:hypothetical protein Rt10032_c12g4852 [Rhodotorula toruloides]